MLHMASSSHIGQSRFRKGNETVIDQILIQCVCVWGGAQLGHRN